MKMRLIDYPTIIICLVVFFIAGMFAGYVLAEIYDTQPFEHEYVVKVQPMGYYPYPYRPNKIYFTTLPYENHRVNIKNGVVVRVERLGYSFK